MTDLLLLAERVEGAEAIEQRELLEWAWQEIHGWPPAVSRGDDAARFIRMLDAEAYESAALTLVPEGWLWAGGSSPSLGAAMAVTKDGTTDGVEAKASTAALALTAACLRARHSMEGLS